MWNRRALLSAAFMLTIGVASVRAGGLSDLSAAERFRDQGRWTEAESLATAALVGFSQEPPADSLAIARACGVVASSRWRRNAADRDTFAADLAGRNLDIRLRHQGPEHSDVAAAHSLLGHLLGELGRPDSALVHARRGLEIRLAQQSPNDTLIAQSWREVSDQQLELRDPGGAAASLEQAIALYERTPGTERARADALASLGFVQSRLDQRGRAKASVRAAIDLLERRYGADETALWDPLNTLAGMELADGNPTPALELFRRALERTKVAFGFEASQSLTIRYNMQLCLQQLGDYAGALQVLETLLPAYVRLHGPEHPRTMAVRQARAFVLSRLDRETDALADYRELAAIYERRGGPLNPNHVLALREIAYLTRRQGRFDEARMTCERAITLESSSPRPIGSSLYSLQMMLVSILEEVDDRPALDRSAAELRRLAEHYRLGSMLDRANLEYWLSHIDEACERPDSAWTHALESEGFARRRVRLNLESSPDRRGLQFARRNSIYLDRVLDLAGDDPLRADDAWDRLVRTRGQSARELSRRRLLPAMRSDTALVRAHSDWIEAQRRYAARLVQSPPRDSAGRAELDAFRAAAENAEQDFATRLRRRGTGLAAADPGLADLRARLAANAVLIGIVEPHADADSSRLIAFVTDRDGPVRRIDLGLAAALRDEIDPWLTALTAPPARGAESAARGEVHCREIGRRIRALTWDRFPLGAEVRDVYVVGDGPLLDLPWDALPDGHTGYLVESGIRVHRLQAERDLPDGLPEFPEGELLAVGAPDFARGGPAGAGAASPLSGWLRSGSPCDAEAFPPLPGTAREVRAVTRSWQATGSGARVLLGADAEEATFKREAPGHAVLHLATHGYVIRDSCPEAAAGTRGIGGVVVGAKRPAKSAPSAKPDAASAPAVTARPAAGQRVWLAFAGADHASDHRNDENEGLLTAEEALTLDLAGTDWVVLSACHSGAAERWRREGARGMREAFHFAGARCVIASQWAVADDATAEWMSALYAARARGEHSATGAVVDAERAVLATRRAAGRSTHPFYWAAFSASGD